MYGMIAGFIATELQLYIRFSGDRFNLISDGIIISDSFTDKAQD
tara:strand:- start:235 stop:366 length:132 start_codon:yes stop_codon:yes gene_type:complete